MDRHVRQKFALCFKRYAFAELREFLVLSFLFLVFINSAVFAQGKEAHVVTQVEISPKTVIVGQPIDIKVGVFTSTYFTKAAEFEKVTIPGAFTIPASRPLSTNTQIDRATYYGVEYSYKLFPAREGDIVFPSITVTVYTPDEGGYQADPRQVKTPERQITVKSVPSNYSRDTWLVADNVMISESWNKDVSTLKVGDAVERTITINATGTVAALIPPIQHDSLAWGSLYPKSALLDDSPNALNATRIERLTYLAEQHGTYTLPSIRIGWWNVGTQKYSEKSIAARQVVIEDNPDLALLRTMQDSLNALKRSQSSEGEKKSLTIFGLNIWQAFIVAALIIALIFILKKVFGIVREKVINRRERYRSSEACYFKRFRKTILGEPRELYQRFTEWINTLVNRPMPTREFIKLYGSEQLLHSFSALELILFKDEKNNDFQRKEFLKQCNAARDRYRKRTVFEKEVESGLPELNPTMS